MAEIKLKVGEFYKTNDGTKVKCIEKSVTGNFGVKGHYGLVWYYEPNGILIGRASIPKSKYHIVSKWKK